MSDLWCWGANSHGQLGLSYSSEQVDRPTKVTSEEVSGARVNATAGGGAHTIIALHDDVGRVWTCGWNSNGQLGRSPPDKKSEDHNFAPTVIPMANKITAVSCGWSHSVAVDSNGLVFACGSNAYGQLGLGANCREAHYFTAVDTKGQLVRSVACGLRHTVLLAADGTLLVCGSNKRGQLGAESEQRSDVFELRSVCLGERAHSVSAGQFFTLALMSSGKVCGFGDNRFSQISPEHVPVSSVTLMETPAPVRKMCAGWTHVILLLADGRVMTGGRNNYAQLGHSPSDGRRALQVVSGLTARDIAAGSEHCLVLEASGRLLAWGWNEHANCGTGDSRHIANDPALIEMPQDKIVKTIYAASAHNFVITTTSL